MGLQGVAEGAERAPFRNRSSMPPRRPRPPRPTPRAPTGPPPGPRGPRRAPRRRARPRPRAWRPPLPPPRPPGAPGPFSGSSLGPRASAMRSVGIVRVTDLRVRGGPPGPGEAGRPEPQGRPKRPPPAGETPPPGEAFRAVSTPPKGGVRTECQGGARPARGNLGEVVRSCLTPPRGSFPSLGKGRGSSLPLRFLPALSQPGIPGAVHSAFELWLVTFPRRRFCASPRSERSGRSRVRMPPAGERTMDL